MGMGCSAAKNLTVEPLEGNAAATAATNGHAKAVSVSRKVSDVPPLEGEEPQAEMLDDAHINNIHKGANGLSFEIAFEDEDESIIKKHPPKRLQRLEETIPSVPTLEKLQEKLEEAEERRQQILQQRVQSAKQRNALKKQSSVTSMTDEIDQSKTDPPDIPPATNNSAFESN